MSAISRSWLPRPWRARRSTGSEIDAIAVTHGPGLVSSLLIGLSGARALGQALGKPVWGVNHLEAHVAGMFLDPAAPPPAECCPVLVLLVSGGHSALLEMLAVGDYRLLGQTLDDAAGECLDKGANLLGLGYPGGPVIERAAQGGNPAYVKFPRGMEHAKNRKTDNGLDIEMCLSFSGLKTALALPPEKPSGRPGRRIWRIWRHPIRKP